MGFYPYNPALGQTIQGEPGAEPVDMAFLAHYQVTPAAVDADGIHAAIPLGTAVQTITTGITNPDIPRVLTVVGNQAGIAGTVVVTGVDIAGGSISDSFALNGTVTVTGTRAFKTVSAIQVPAKSNDGDEVVVGWSKILGLPHKVYNASCLLVKLLDGSNDSGSLAVNSELSKNLYTMNGDPDGSKDLDLFYIV